MTACGITVVLSTRNRAEILHETLQCFCHQQINIPWEIIVVDNGSTDATLSVLDGMLARLPLQILSQPKVGKSCAVNLALNVARGELIIFTDDDVRPVPQWLSEYARAFRQYTDAAVFCGPIVPLHPAETPEWLANHAYASVAFGRFTPPLEEGDLPAPILPFGPNFAITSSALGGMRMREDLGPSEQGKFMGEDTALVSQFRKRLCRFIFLPTAGVGHYVRREQLHLSWLFDRAFWMGRSIILQANEIDKRIPKPRDLSKAADYFEYGADLNYLLGQLCQLNLTGNKSQSDRLTKLIAGFQWLGDSRLLSKPAQQWLLDDPFALPGSARQRF